MEKARSRLQSISSHKITPAIPTKPVKLVSARKSPSSVIKAYFNHLPALVVAGLCFGVVYLILTKVHPDQIRHFILPNSYLPLLIPVFLGNVFLWSLVFLHTRRGVLASCLLTLWLFLKLQQVVFTLPVMLAPLVALLLTELICTLIFKRRSVR